MLAGGRFQRVITDVGGQLVAYLFTAWQYLDLHVLKVATLPGFRRQGLARRLMEIAERHCSEAGGETITLEVRPSNDDAIALYEALGYQRIGRRPGYYANGEDALVMTKQIRA
jgi:ribosomal-protein-alanine acetyltransferase